MEDLDLNVVSDFVRQAKSLSIPRLKPPLRVVRDYGTVALFDKDDILVLAMSEKVWDDLRV
jgi:hypothetical protein